MGIIGSEITGNLLFPVIRNWLHYTTVHERKVSYLLTAMAAKAQWLQRVPEILDILVSLPGPVVDRASIEKIFGVGRRRAITLLHSFGGFQTGKTFFIERLALIGQLEQLRKGVEFRAEWQRRNRLAEGLILASRLIRGRQMKITAADDARGRQLADLPSGIALQSGELRIKFSGGEDLLRQLFELSQAILNNYEQFEKIVAKS